MTTPAKPGRLSVIVTCYNQATLIVPMLSALLSDLKLGDEVIISDDGSTDGSADTIRRVMAADCRVRVLDGTRSASVSRTRNRGLAAATGDWVSFLDGDDEYCAGRREHLINGMRAFPNAQVLFTDYALWRPDENAPNESRMPETHTAEGQLAAIVGGNFESWQTVDAEAITTLLLERGSILHVCCIAIARSWIEARALQFDSRLAVAEDTDFVIRALQGAHVAFLPLVTAKYRVSELGLSARCDVDARVARLLQRMSNLQLASAAPSAKGEAAAWRQIGDAELLLAYQLRLDGHHRAALRFALRSFVTTPGHRALAEIAKACWRLCVPEGARTGTSTVRAQTRAPVVISRPITPLPMAAIAHPSVAESTARPQHRASA